MRGPIWLLRVSFAVALGAGLLLGGCERIDDGLDRVPPRVVSVSPALPVVPVTTSFQIAFSERLDPSSVDEERTSDTVSVVLVPRAAVTSAFLSDIGNPPLIESRQQTCLSITVDARGDVLTVTPDVLLTPRTAYTLLVGSSVRDEAGNPIVDALGLKASFRYDFDTDAGAPAVVTTDVGTGLVAPNRRRFTVSFNQPVVNVGESTLTLSPAVPLEAVLLDASRTEATVFLAPGTGCERMSTNTDYILRVSDGVTADTGQALVPFEATFQTGPACDTTPHRTSGPASAVVGEVSATVHYGTNKPSTTSLRFGLEGGPLDCLGAPCPIVGPAARVATAGATPLTFDHTVAITGLTVDNRYRVVMSAEDDVGGVAVTELTFLTEPLPKLAVNEVMNNPTGTESAGEFIELVNFGDVDLDISGWRVDVTGNSLCSATIAANTVLAPGAFILVVGNSFVPSTYGLADGEVALNRSSGANICGSGLLNDGVSVVVVEPAGRPITSMGKHLRPEEGRSMERIAPELADVASSVCLSRTDTGPTPGRQNGVTLQGCQ